MNRIKKLRKKEGITLKELSAIIGINDGQLSNYENGKRSPRDPKIWEKIADYFGVSVGYVMGVSSDPKKYEDEITYFNGKEIVALSSSPNDPFSWIDKKLLATFNRLDVDRKEKVLDYSEEQLKLQLINSENVDVD
ncbi:MAG: helix-turn-helix transcriptional regulator [Lactobacillales bacterium]|jgi:transcriptional regulator with XRE-family HTH domain|nr:helix-turn-helix transcriptional regulator [Lactobacillales bacterium]